MKDFFVLFCISGIFALPVYMESLTNFIHKFIPSINYAEYNLLLVKKQNNPWQIFSLLDAVLIFPAINLFNCLYAYELSSLDKILTIIAFACAVISFLEIIKANTK